jgi:hypothetical protein
MNSREVNRNNSKSFIATLKAPALTPIKLDNNSIKELENLNISNKENNYSTQINQNSNNNKNKAILKNSIDNNLDQNSNEVIAKILDAISKNSLNIFYDSESEFKNKIDSLNLKFYLETEKYLSNQNKKAKTQTSLFIILFKQINIYIEEIQRLNMIILTKKYEPENIIKRTDELNQKQKEFQAQEKIINALKISQFNMENKLLQAVINENNLNKKIEDLQKEIEIYKNKIISMKNNSETHKIKIDKIMSNSFQNRNTQIVCEEMNCKINKNKNCYSISITNGFNNNPLSNNNNMNISINKSIKSKSPNGYNSKDYPLKLRKINKNINIDVKRNHSQNDSKSKMNNYIKNENKNIIGKNKSKYVINKEIIKKQNTNTNPNTKEMIYLGNLITKLNKTEKVTKKNSKVQFDLEERKNTIDLVNNNEQYIQRNNYSKIIINNKNKTLKEENINNYAIRKKYKNNLENDALFNSTKLTKTKIIKSDLDTNKCSNNEIHNYSCFNTIENDNEKEKCENVLNCLKLMKNKKKKENENYYNIDKIINKSITNNFKSKSLLKNKENRNKNCINISNSIRIRKNNNSNTKKKF